MENQGVKSPILIHGILTRTGTNYLNQLILIDTSCEQPISRIRENWFLEDSDSLIQYSDKLTDVYSNSGWAGGDFKKDDLIERIGKGLIDFLQNQLLNSNNRLVTKTPCVKNIKNIERLFPDAKNIIIVRNPLDVAASAFNSWKTPVEKTIVDWNEGVDHILEYEKRMNGNYLVIRYEDLINNLDETFKLCINFLELNPEAFSWDEINSLPIYGTSDNGSEWKIIKKEKSFQAIGKWKLLPEDQIESLKRVFKDEYAAYFGYAGLEEEDVLSPLPSLQERLSLGEKLIKNVDESKDNDEIKESNGQRLRDLKSAIKLLKQSILGR